MKWEEGEVDISADAAVAAAIASSGGRKTDAQAEVRRFLIGMLAGSARVLQKQIMEEGQRLGFSEKQIRTAARKLRVSMEKPGFDDPWVWTLPM